MALNFPIKLEAYDKTLAFKGEIASPDEVHLTPRWNQAGDCTFTVDADHPRVNDLVTEGARVVAQYRYDDDADWCVRLSGIAEEITGEGEEPETKRTFAIRDDWTTAFNLLGWPNPAGTILQQGTSAYYTSTGPAETVVTDVLSQNAARTGLDIDCPASQGRGDTITVKLRMHPLVDRLYPKVHDAGIGCRIVQSDGRRRLVITEQQTHVRELTEKSHVVQGKGFTSTLPLATRIVVGAGGQDVARVFREFIDADLESLIGEPRELFVDARDVSPDAVDLDAQCQDRADQAFAENAAKVALNAVLAETGAFKFGRTFNVGDVISVRLAGVPLITDYVRECQIDWTADDGLMVTPVMGQWSDSTDSRLHAVVAAALKDLRDLKRR